MAVTGNKCFICGKHFHENDKVMRTSQGHRYCFDRIKCNKRKIKDESNKNR